MAEGGDDPRRAPLVLAGVVLAAVLGATAGSAPSGLDATDPVLAGLAVAVVAHAGGRSPRWAPLVAAGVGATLAASGVGLACGLAGLAAGTASGWRRRPSEPLAVLASGLGAGALARMGDIGFHGLSTLVAAAALAPILVTGYRARAVPDKRWGRRRARRARLAAGALGAFVLATLAGAGLAGLLARDDLAAGRSALERGVDAARAGDTEAAARHLRDAAGAFAAADRDLDAWWAVPGRAVPVLGQNLRALLTATDVAATVAEAGAELAARASSDGLEVQAGRVPVDAIADLDGPVLAALETVLGAERATAEHDSPWLLAPVDRRYRRIAAELAGARPDLELALESTRQLPALLGAGGPRRYLVLFVTPVEGRASGFPGNYAEVVVDGGDLSMPVFGRTSDLDAALDEGAPLDLPADYVARYGRFDLAGEPRFLTVSPHFPSVAEHARQQYAAATGVDLDGVLAVDPSALAGLLRLTGPVSVPQLGRPLPADDAEDFLLRDQYLELPDTPERVDALESLGRATFDRLTGADLPAPPEIADVLAPLAAAGHLRLVAFDAEGGAFLHRIGTTGALGPVAGDGLAVTTNNSIGGKMDLFLHRFVRYDVEWDPATGAVSATAEITLRNEAPTSGLPDYVLAAVPAAAEHPELAGVPPGTNRTYLSVFTPLELADATVDGEPAGFEPQREQGRNVYSRVLVLAPEGGTAVVRLRLEGVVPADPQSGRYRLELWSQLLPNADQVSVTVRSPGGTDRASLALAGPAHLALGEG